MMPLLEDFLTFTLIGNEPACTHGRAPSGIAWRWRGVGMLECTPAADSEQEHNVILSAGIHGDETAPIEILSRLVNDLARGATPLRARLLVLFGNIAAMRAGRRYLDDDLNRLFNGAHHATPNSLEAPRAAALENAVTEFFAAARTQHMHLDLHTAIRPSLFERFAILAARERPYARSVFAFLGAFGIEAILRQRTDSPTFVHYTSRMHGALASTLELGKVMPFGQNDLMRFQAAADALRRLISGAPCASDSALPKPKVFDVVAQIKKCSDAFEFFVEDDAPNFTPYPQGALIARDGDDVYRVTHAQERIVFPNPRVKAGLRAGLMVVESDAYDRG
jgi:succinylglutamate desuccinylase